MSNKVAIKVLSERHRKLVNGMYKDIRLLAPVSFWLSTEAQRLRICNGCGPTSWKSFVPDTMYGLCVTPACNIHDWMYSYGVTMEDKDIADLTFKLNLYRIIDQKSGNWLFKKLRRVRAYGYYLAVSWLGHAAYVKGKRHG